jgi:O-antigen ligase
MQAGSNDAVVFRIHSIAVYSVCLVCLFPFGRQVLRDLILRNPLIAALPALCFISSAWSQQPPHTLIASGFLSIDVCFVAYLLRRFSVNDLMKIFLLVGAIAAATSFLFVLALPQFGIENRYSDVVNGAWQGVFAQKNTLGTEMTYLLSPVFFVRTGWGNARFFKWVYTISCLVLIGFSRSTGSWIVCAAMLFTAMIFSFISRTDRKTAAALVFTGVGVCLVAVAFIVENSDVLLRLLGKESTLTGRTIIWGALFSSFLRSPIHGYGYEGFWMGMRGESGNVGLTMNFAGLSYAESGILDLALALGLIGVILYVLVFCLAVRDALYCLQRNPNRYVMWFSTILVIVVISNLTSGFLLFRGNLQCTLPLLAYMGIRREARRLRRGESTFRPEQQSEAAFALAGQR